MNQTQATEVMSHTINEGLHYSGSVIIGSPVDHEGPDVLLVSYANGLTLSVTVEILAQP